MWSDRVSNPGTLTYESDALPTALRGPAAYAQDDLSFSCLHMKWRRDTIDSTTMRDQYNI